MIKRWRRQVNPAPDPEPITLTALAPAEPGSRLVPDPVFIICSVRSGSTLLRMLLNAHPAVHAPHELHLGGLRVTSNSKRTTAAFGELDLPTVELEHLLWDRVLHRELARSGKQVLVEKTPNNALMWQRLACCWPQARFLFLLRHPATVAASWSDAHEGRRGEAEVLAKVVKSMRAVDEARRHLPGLTVRYEDLTVDPSGQTQRICAFLGLDWEPGMLDYLPGQATFTRGLGDWREKIRSGRVQPARPLPPGPMPAPLLELCTAWDYLGAEPEVTALRHPVSQGC